MIFRRRQNFIPFHATSMSQRNHLDCKLSVKGAAGSLLPNVNKACAERDVELSLLRRAACAVHRVLPCLTFGVFKAIPNNIEMSSQSIDSAGAAMGNKLTLAFILAMFIAIAFPLPSRAQRGFLMGGGQFVRPRPNVPLGHPRQGPILTGPRGHGRFGRGGSAVYPYLYPPYYDSGYYSEPAPTGPQQDRVVVVENSQQPAAVAPAPPPKSLMLERQGDHWVRVTDAGQTVTDLQPGQKGSETAANLRAISPQEGATVEPPPQLPPAVLVFRDGHKEIGRAHV